LNRFYLARRYARLGQRALAGVHGILPGSCAKVPERVLFRLPAGWGFPSFAFAGLRPFMFNSSES
jgi:hypothetical protein